VKCHYCNRAVYKVRREDAAYDTSLIATKDHIRPKSLGGENYKANIVTACHQCNNIRGDTPYEVYYEFSKRYNVHNVEMRRSAYRKYLSDMTVLGVSVALFSGVLDNYKFGG